MLPEVLQKWLENGKNDDPILSRHAKFYKDEEVKPFIGIEKMEFDPSQVQVMRLIGIMKTGHRMTMYFKTDPDNPAVIGECVSKWLKSANLEK